ncbi:hypothetical protein Q8A73_005344 [Channa argus]|nr:hypothetical protein Q8A73_005344 [Channa argus]
MDGWKGNWKFWAHGSVSPSVDLIWVTLCDRKLAEELGDPHSPLQLVKATRTATHSQRHSGARSGNESRRNTGRTLVKSTVFYGEKKKVQ